MIKVSSAKPGASTLPPGLGVNTGDGGVAIGATNTIIAKIGTNTYTLINPQDTVNFEVDSSPLVLTAVYAGTDTTARAFSLISGATEAGLYDIQIFAAKINGIEYVGDGKVKYTKFEVTGEVNGVAKTGTLQGTYDASCIDITSGKAARIVGSFNITQ